MLFFKAFFITSLLIFGSVQYSLQPNSKRLYDVQNVHRKEKSTASSELLSSLIKQHVRLGLKDYKYSAKGLHLPEIKNMLEGAGEYLVIKLDIGEGEAKRLMKDVDGVSATLFGYRERSASDLNIENAAKFFFLSLSISVIRMIIKTALGLFKSPLSQLF